MEIKKIEGMSIGAKQMIEDLADLEHRQWCHIISFLQRLNPDQLRKKIYIDYKDLVHTKYKDLPEDKKELDRFWAKEVLKTQWESAGKELRRQKK